MVWFALKADIPEQIWPMSALCHVWTAPCWQGLLASRSLVGAALQRCSKSSPRQLSAPRIQPGAMSACRTRQRSLSGTCRGGQRSWWWVLSIATKPFV